MEKLVSNIYIEPIWELKLSSDELLKLVKSLYELSDASDYWNRTIIKPLKKDLDTSETSVDSLLYFKIHQNELTGLIR